MKITKKKLWVAAVVTVSLLIPFEPHIDSINLPKIYPGPLEATVEIRDPYSMVIVMYQGYRIAVHVNPLHEIPDAQEAAGSLYGFEDETAPSSVGALGRFTRFRQDPGNLARGVKIAYPCRLRFARLNVIVHVDFEGTESINWQPEVNRLTDQEQIALLTKIAEVLDNALIEENSAVVRRRLNLWDIIGIKIKKKWSDLEIWFWGGGRYHE